MGGGVPFFCSIYQFCGIVLNMIRVPDTILKRSSSRRQSPYSQRAYTSVREEDTRKMASLWFVWACAAEAAGRLREEGPLLSLKVRRVRRGSLSQERVMSTLLQSSRTPKRQMSFITKITGPQVQNKLPAIIWTRHLSIYNSLRAMYVTLDHRFKCLFTTTLGYFFIILHFHL